MKKVWSAKVHTSGDRIQLLKNGSVTKVIRASSETFAPVAAKEFAEGLVNQLNTKYAKQMTDPSKDPDVATKGEQHAVDMKAVNRDAKGISVKEASAQNENLILKKKIASLEKEAMVERKARRGLAIVKTLVDQKKIANDQAIIKSEVMKIVAMSNDEIGLLERKVAGKQLYDSKEDATIASVRYARMSRLHHQAAEDAHLAGNLKLADDEDLRADRYENLAKQAYAVSNEYAQYKAEADKGTSEDIANQIKKTPKGVDAQGKIASDDNDADDVDGDSDPVDDDDDELIDSIDEDDEEDMQVEAAVAIYKKIAADHRKKADELKIQGNDEGAKVESEIADEADSLADSIDDDEEEEYGKEAAAIYRRIASEHRKKADEFETEGDDANADIEDEIADEAEQLAASVESSISKCSEANVASVETPAVKEAEVAAPAVKEAEVAAPAVKEAEVAAPAVKEAEVAAPVAKEAEAVVPAAPVAPAIPEKKAEEEMPEIMKNAEPDAAATDEDATAETTDEDANDPLAALLDESEKEAACKTADEQEVDDSMPTDEEIDAAVAGDSSIEEDADADVDTIDKDASTTNTKKIANEGYSKTASMDRPEQNPMTHDSQVRELEDFWRHDSQE